MHLERALITGVGSSPLPPARAVRGLVATGAQVGLAGNRFFPTGKLLLAWQLAPRACGQQLGPGGIA